MLGSVLSFVKELGQQYQRALTASPSHQATRNEGPRRRKRARACLLTFLSAETTQQLLIDSTNSEVCRLAVNIRFILFRVIKCIYIHICNYVSMLSLLPVMVARIQLFGLPFPLNVLVRGHQRGLWHVLAFKLFRNGS